MHQVAKAYIRKPVLRFERTVRRIREQVLFDARETKMELWMRGMTIAGMMKRVLQWVGERDRVLTARYERQRTISCEGRRSGRESSQSVSGRKAEDNSGPRAVN